MIKGSEVLSIDGIVPGYSFFAKKKISYLWKTSLWVVMNCRSSMQQLYNGVYSVPLYTYLLTKKSEQWCLNPFEVFLKIFLVCTWEIFKKVKKKYKYWKILCVI